MAIPLCVLFLNVYYYNYVFMCISRCGYVYVFAVPARARGPGHYMGLQAGVADH